MIKKIRRKMNDLYWFIHEYKRHSEYDHWANSRYYVAPRADKQRLSEWMLPDGTYIPIKRMNDTELRYAILLIDRGCRTGGQKSKIISLRKERARRSNGE